MMQNWKKIVVILEYEYKYLLKWKHQITVILSEQKIKNIHQ